MPMIDNSFETKSNAGKLLDRKAAAQFLGVQENTLATWATNKRYSLPYVKVGRLARYRMSDLMDFIERRTLNKEASLESEGFKNA